MEQNYKYIVATECFTFNHASYIEETLRGFAMQETAFPAVFCIVDDASTDGESDILRKWAEKNLEYYGIELWKDLEYGKIAEAPLKGKRQLSFVILLLANNYHNQHKAKRPLIMKWLNNAKYNALCEGDDYWTDPAKLQKGVTYMENHQNCSLCFHAHKNVFSDVIISNKVIKRYESDMDSVPMKDIIKYGGGFMATSSMLFKSEKINNRPSWSLNTPVGDFPKMLLLASRGDVAYINDVMSCYRQDSSGSWSSRVIADKKLYLRWYHGIITMMKGFDEWTDKKYHVFVYQYLFNHRKSRMRYELSRVKNKIINIFK